MCANEGARTARSDARVAQDNCDNEASTSQTTDNQATAEDTVENDARNGGDETDAGDVTDENEVRISLETNVVDSNVEGDINEETARDREADVAGSSRESNEEGTAEGEVGEVREIEVSEAIEATEQSGAEASEESLTFDENHFSTPVGGASPQPRRRRATTSSLEDSEVRGRRATCGMYASL